mgnify:FL=1
MIQCQCCEDDGDDGGSLKTDAAVRTPPLRPRWSATYAPESAPKKVPYEKEGREKAKSVSSSQTSVPPRKPSKLTMDRKDVMRDLDVEEMQ